MHVVWHHRVNNVTEYEARLLCIQVLWLFTLNFQKYMFMTWFRTTLPAAVRVLSFCGPPPTCPGTAAASSLASESSPSLESSTSSSSSSDSASGNAYKRARLCSIRQTVIISHALTGATRRRRRQCHLLLATPIDLSTVVRAELWWKLNAISRCVRGFVSGVRSQSRSIYPLSPNRKPVTGLWLLSKASNKAERRKIRASWTLPGHLATTSTNFSSASHTTCR